MRAYGSHGSSADKKDLSKESQAEAFLQVAGFASRMNAGSPQNLVGHPVAHAWKVALIEQQGFDRALGMSFQGRPYQLGPEIEMQHGDGKAFPPLGLFFSFFKTNSAELPWVSKHQGLTRLPQDQGIMFARSVFGGLDIERTSHAKVRSQP